MSRRGIISRMEWDDLRYVLAVYSAGSVAGAAVQLRVSSITVFRRLKVIEKQLGVRLFDRTRKGYAVTPSGLEVVRQAQRIEEDVGALERRIWRQDKQLHGLVRVTAPDTTSAFIVTPLMPDLQQLHPGITLDLNVDNRVLDISRRDADIAIRTTTRPPENLIGHRVGTLLYATYAATGLVPRSKARTVDLTKVPWVGLDSSIGGNRVAAYQDFMQKQVPPGRMVLRTHSPLAMTLAVKAGVGVGILSCITAARLGGLVRLGPTIDELSTELWILSHPELRDVARVAAVYGYFREALIRLRPLFLGEETKGRG
ncbi:MAG: LysR family transcriptional regulator [Gammaproteobacteria bacterium]